MTHTVVEFDALLGSDGAAAIVDLCERFGRYGMYSQEYVESEIGHGLSQRHDAASNFVRTGGRFARDEPAATLAARTNYFREEYAYGAEPIIEGIEPYLFHEGFADAARKVHGRTVIEPAIVFANLMVPGQELAVHTDVPEFRGCNRKVMPQWLLVAMHHSGLFDVWRMPIATGVAWFHDCEGGEFCFYPDGAEGTPVAKPVTYDTALLFDADSVFHGVDRIDAEGAGRDIAPLRPGMSLDFAGDRQWVVHDGDDVVANYKWDELRFSVSWKAYCFEDEREQQTWREHADDLTLDYVVGRLVEDLRARGRIARDVPGNPDLALMIIDEYIRFPEAQAVG
ncbi:MAG: hypothetical protein QOC92_2451 [Acidimicrobiaceae bacterium]